MLIYVPVDGGLEEERLDDQGQEASQEQGRSK
jgi:hypothetical protein